MITLVQMFREHAARKNFFRLGLDLYQKFIVSDTDWAYPPHRNAPSFFIIYPVALFVLSKLEIVHHSAAHMKLIV